MLIEMLQRENIRIVVGRFCHFSMSSSLFQAKSYCTNISEDSNQGNGGEEGCMSKYDAYKKLEHLDFPTAAEILFSKSQRKKKFGFDFHLVQLFFACLPSLGVYLVAQYSRYEMRKMEAVVEKKKQAEAEKAEEVRLKEEEEATARTHPDIVEVKERLVKLEETIKTIVSESKKASDSVTKNEPKTGDDKGSRASQSEDGGKHN